MFYMRSPIIFTPTAQAKQHTAQRTLTLLQNVQTKCTMLMKLNKAVYSVLDCGSTLILAQTYLGFVIICHKIYGKQSETLSDYSNFPNQRLLFVCCGLKK